jgi:hypothetical protein
LGGGKGELFVDLGADGAVGVIPGVVDTHVDEFLQPLAGEEVIDIGLAEAGGHAGHEASIETVLQAAQGTVEHVFATASFIGDRAGAFHADQGRGIAKFAQGVGRLGRDHLAIGEDLEIAIGVSGEEIKQLGMHEGLSAEHAEEDVAMAFGVVHDFVEFVQVHRLPWFVHIHPAALAAEVAGVENRKVEEGRENLSGGFHSLFELQH